MANNKIYFLFTTAMLLLLACLPSFTNANHEGGDGKIVEFTVANLSEDYVGSNNKFRIQLEPTWSPLGVQRFEELTSDKFWDNTYIFRVVSNFISQWGINSDPMKQQEWKDKGNIMDDPSIDGVSNDRGTVTFATSGSNSRTTQLFINTNDNAFLDSQGFTPIGKVLEGGCDDANDVSTCYGGMEVVDAFYSEYGESPDQWKITTEGSNYLEEEFPNLSYFVSADFVGGHDDGDAEDTDEDNDEVSATIPTIITDMDNTNGVEDDGSGGTEEQEPLVDMDGNDNEMADIANMGKVDPTMNFSSSVSLCSSLITIIIGVTVSFFF